MSLDVLYVLDPGLGLHLQDRGRVGWRRFGIPQGGAMDSHAADWANRLLDNPTGTAVLELLLQGAKLAALRPVWIAITGADAGCPLPTWRAIQLQADDVISFPRNLLGVWTYIAVEGGFIDDPLFGSVSASPRVKLGRTFTRGSILRRSERRSFSLPPGVAGRSVPHSEHPDYSRTPVLRVWPGPQWEAFPPSARIAFLNQPWRVSSRCDRTGYRLEGQALGAGGGQILSEPVKVGSVQVPPDGQPIVTLNDGPTMGGYPKLALVDPGDLGRLVQCRGGQQVRFTLAK
ncbi:MAG TPA: allophanate hydrolase [Verrucomicrobiales bacterium]|nr:allophanate hydrolase [Verrucomicrobiales bacterium]